MNSEEKPTLRLRVRGMLRALGPDDLAVKSSAIAAHLATGIRGRVFGFAPMRREPDWLIAGWPGEIALPRIKGGRLMFHAVGAAENLVPGAFGVREPAGAEAIEIFPSPADTILVPGLAFDRSGGRLGRGGGFYDRFLAGVPGRKVGVCFAGQLVDFVPMEPHDVRVDAVVTEDGWIDARSNASGRD